MKHKAEVGMILVTILWGANFVVGKVAMDGGLTPNFYTAMRFLGAFAFLALIYHKRLLRAGKGAWKAGRSC